MQTSRFLAKLIGPLLVAIGAALMLNPGVYRVMMNEILASYGLIYLAGVISLTAGLAIVNTHNVWTLDWRVVITLLGWLTLLGGVTRLVFPRLAETVGTMIVAKDDWILINGVVLLVFGAWLSFMGYRDLLPPTPRKRGGRK